jgi:hypothetical protein
MTVHSVERPFLSTFKESEASWVKQDERGVCLTVWLLFSRIFFVYFKWKTSITKDKFCSD